MSKPIQISISKPCHEKWEEMTPMEKGRFCASCQKKVYDFTNSSDREITTILKNKKSVCGHVRLSQLNRDLIIPKEKNKFWLAVNTLILAFISLGSNKAIAQEEPIQTEKHEVNTNLTEVKNDTINTTDQVYFISGVVSESLGPIPAASVTNINLNQKVLTNFDGKYTIRVNEGDTIEFYFTSFIKKVIIIDDLEKSYNIVLEEDVEYIRDNTFIDGGVFFKNKSFFGRLFYSIGNWFR